MVHVNLLNIVMSLCRPCRGEAFFEGCLERGAPDIDCMFKNHVGNGVLSMSPFYVLQKHTQNLGETTIFEDEQKACIKKWCRGPGLPANYTLLLHISHGNGTFAVDYGCRRHAQGITK